MRLHSYKQGNDATDTPPNGFTIVELMIAMSILSVLLLISSLTLISIGRLYSKGVNEAATQNTTRNITNNLASQLQLAGSTPVINPGGQPVICIGSQRYTYQLAHELTSASNDHVLWHDTMTGTTGCSALNLNSNTPGAGDPDVVPGSGSEMVPLHMRLTDFSLAPGTGSNYDLIIGVAYTSGGISGGDDLLCNSAVPSECSTPGVTPHIHILNHTGGHILCRGRSGTEYCAVSLLTTNVGRRLSGS